MTLLRLPLYKSIALVVAFCTLPLLLFPLIEWAALSFYGAFIFNFLELLLVLFLLLTSLLLLFAPIGLFFPAVRKGSLLALIGAVVFLGASYFGISFGVLIRHRAFVAMAEHSTPLVEAITAYTHEMGSPPPSLEALVPHYIEKVPTTGIRNYPSYKYRCGSDAASFEGNPWILYVYCSRGFLNFDTFYYFPCQNYPDSGYGGTFQRIRDWGYLHE